MTRPRLLSVVVTLCLDDLKHLAKDRTALFLMVVLPVMVMVVVGATFGSIPDRMPVGLLVADDSPAAADLRAVVERTPTIAVYPYDDAEALRRDVRTRNLDGGFIIPAGFGAAVARGETVMLPMLVDLTQPNAQSLATLLQATVAQEGEVLAAARFSAEQTGEAPAAAAERARQLVGIVSEVPVVVETLRVDLPATATSPNATNPYAYSAISNVVLFVFVSTLAGAGAIVERRQLGITRRMLAAPVTTRGIVLGTAASRLGVAVAQSYVILAVGRLLFDVYWGDPVGVALLIVTFAALATGVSLLVGAVVSNPNQVQAVGIPVAIGLGMLGGCMWPLELVPPPMQVIGHGTPHAWAMDAWIRLALEGAPWSAVVSHLGVLTGIAAVLAVVSALALRRSLVRG